MALRFTNSVVYLVNGDFHDNGDLKVKHKNPVFVAVLADWCPHCINVKPEIQRFADRVKDVNVAVIDSTGREPGQQQLMEKNRMHSIYPALRGFPTLFVIKPNGDKVAYSGQRTSEEFERFIRNL